MSVISKPVWLCILFFVKLVFIQTSNSLEIITGFRIDFLYGCAFLTSGFIIIIIVLLQRHLC